MVLILFATRLFTLYADPSPSDDVKEIRIIHDSTSCSGFIFHNRTLSRCTETLTKCDSLFL